MENKVIILGAGIGAMTMGFENAGCSVVAAYERDRRAIELYTYETDPSAQIVSFKFKDPESVREEGDDEETGEYKEKLGMSLGLGINTADKGVVVELQLTVAGDVAREENSICVYEDPDQPIGKIVDISYNYE